MGPANPGWSAPPVEIHRMARPHRRRVLLAFAVAGLACSAGPRLPRTSDAVALEVGGAVKGGPFRLSEADVAALPRAEVRGVDPRTGQAATYHGLALAELEERVELERGADTLVLHAAGGEEIPIPLSVVRQLRPVLASRADDARLEARVLAWPNVAHHGLNTDPRAPLWWVRRVVKVDFVSWPRVYGKALRIPEGAPRGALAGARTFGARCIGCHELRGTGGANGPGLEQGGAFTEPARLRAILADHPGVGGTGLPAAAPERVDEVAAFLKVIAATPAEPDDEEAGP
jgi:mono/diheme cytochrome c family protein